MTRIYEERHTTRTDMVLIKIECTICKQAITEPCYEVDNVTIKRETGSRYPDGGDIEYREYDICGKCFDEKVEPLLKSLGAEPEVSEVSY